MEYREELTLFPPKTMLSSVNSWRINFMHDNGRCQKTIDSDLIIGMFGYKTVDIILPLIAEIERCKYFRSRNLLYKSVLKKKMKS